MRPAEMLRKLQDVYGGRKVKLMAAAEEALTSKMVRFSPDQLDAIYEKILDECKYFPKPADIYSAARDLGFVDKGPQYKASTPHAWSAGSCSLCRGEGRIAVYFEAYAVETERGIEQRRRRTRIFPYTAPERIDYDYKQRGPLEYSSIARCSCAAGDAPTLPHDIPRWKWGPEASREKHA